MKTLFALMFTLSTISAFAGEVILIDRNINSYSDLMSYSQEFDANPELGRAWTVVKFAEPGEGPFLYR